VKMERAYRILHELGLTDYETRTYAGLVSAGPSTAGELSKSASVPYSRIYDILSRLERRGWVEVQSGRPTRYRAKAPAEVVRLLKIDQERHLKELGEGVIKELEPLYESRAEAKRPDIWILRGERNLLAKAEEMLAHAQVEALISLPRMTREVAKLGSFLPALGMKNIAVRVLAAGKPKLKKSELPKNLEIRGRKTLFGGGVVVDGREVLLVLGGGGEVVGIWADEIGLARYAKEYFEYLWKDSSKT
jgi:sugar-specific transcriptional regulator TrmB